VAQHNPKVVVVCPRLVPDAPILRYAGTFGLASNTTTTDFYALTFNNGGSDPTSPLSLHWVVGRGTWAAMRRQVLSDAHNEVRRRPTYLEHESSRAVRCGSTAFPNTRQAACTARR
jgi:dihydrofolate reductase